MRIRSLLCGVLAALLLPLPTAAAGLLIAPRSVEPSRLVSDYSGKGAVIAVLDRAFDTEHPVFAEAPASPRLGASDGGEYYVNAKIPYARDYTDGDGGVSGVSFLGTAAASLAAGFLPRTETVDEEDPTLVYGFSYTGTAPDAQLLMMKIYPDYESEPDADAIAAAVTDAVRLGADAIVINLNFATVTATMQAAIDPALDAGIPIFVGAGDTSLSNFDLPASYVDRSTLSKAADLRGVTVVGSASDPYTGVSECTLRIPGQDDVFLPYTDTSAEYFGISFAAAFGGTELPIVVVPGIGSDGDYAGIDVSGAFAVIRRGEISFTEKARIAAAHGAVGMLVVNTEDNTSTRMLLTGAPIPGVLMAASVGEALLTAPAGAVVAFDAPSASPSYFSASGMSADMTQTVDVLAVGESCVAAIPHDPDAGSVSDSFINLNGTYYAAAVAAGYLARAAEYCRAAGIAPEGAQALMLQAAERREDAVLRCEGAGILTERGEYPQIYAGTHVLAQQVRSYYAAYLPVTLTNPTDRPRTVTISASLRTEEVEVFDGTPYLTGNTEENPLLRMYLGDDAKNLAAVTETATVPAHGSLALTLRLVVPPSAQEILEETFPYGLYTDGEIFFTDEDGICTVQPYTVFFGVMSGPIVDASIYDGEEAVFFPSMLYVSYSERGNAYSYAIGSDNPYVRSDGTEWKQEYNYLSTRLLTSLDFNFCALRDIREMQVFFYDEAGRLVYSDSCGDLKKYSTDGDVYAQVWDFRAEDESDYVFPDGRYTCVFTFFPEGAGAPQTMRFELTVDSVRPRVAGYSLETTADGRMLLRVEAEDDHVLLWTSANDAYYGIEYEAVEGSVFSSAPQNTVTFDVSAHNWKHPLYIRVEDLAGNFFVVRIPAAG